MWHCDCPDRSVIIKQKPWSHLNHTLISIFIQELWSFSEQCRFLRKYLHKNSYGMSSKGKQIIVLLFVEYVIWFHCCAASQHRYQYLPIVQHPDLQLSLKNFVLWCDPIVFLFRLVMYWTCLLCYTILHTTYQRALYSHSKIQKLSKINKYKNSKLIIHTLKVNTWMIIFRVDRDRSGYISAEELQMALSNGTWNPFNLQTVKLMIGMFDRQGRGTVSFEEFGNLWKYVVDWQNCFKSFDRDNSGSLQVLQ